MESTQHLLDHVRPPRVHITYDVEIGDAIEVVELPFVMGILADLSGHNNANLAPVRERKFTEIDGSSFNQVLEAANPGIVMSVPDTTKNDGSALAVSLSFKSLSDFDPVQVANQVPELAELYQLRTRLSEIAGRLSSNEAFNVMMENLVQTPDTLSNLQKLVAPPASGSDAKSGDADASSGSDPKPSAKK